MTENRHKRLRVRIYIAERNEGMVWVPYKALIGHTIRGREIIGLSRAQVHCFEAFETKRDAIAEMKRRASTRIMELFGHVEQAEIEWEIRHERGPELIAVTYEDASHATATEAVATPAA